MLSNPSGPTGFDPTPSERRRPNAGLPTLGTRAFICGLEGLELTSFERTYLREAQPWGIILFGRNVNEPDQVRRLTDAARDALGWQAPVLVDQEGGRVQRLRPPHWNSYPAAGRFGAMEVAQPGAGVEAAQIAAWLMADDLLDIGIDVNCAPVLDLRTAGGTNAIGNRAYHSTVEAVSIVARAVHDAYLQAGVVPLVKHMPGHGRAVVDSHLSLPRISASRETLETTDFLPFRALNDAPLAMTGHLVFEAIDPDLPATLSPTMIGIIRDHIGFDGALLSDDLSMGALTGPLHQRASAAIQAGCDLALHCNGLRTEMEDVVAAVPLLESRAAERCASALSRRGRQSLDRAVLTDRFETLLSGFDTEAMGADPTAFTSSV